MVTEIWQVRDAIGRLILHWPAIEDEVDLNDWATAAMKVVVRGDRPVDGHAELMTMFRRTTGH